MSPNALAPHLVESPQAKEADDARRTADARVSELSYANSKLAGELDALHAAARQGAERDRRALRSLREGLAEVEAEVEARAQRGYTQVGAAWSERLGGGLGCKHVGLPGTRV